MCFVFPWRPRRTAHKTIMKALKGHQSSARRQRLSYCGTWRSYTTWRSPPRTPSPIISGLLRPAKIGLASERMTHGMTKLLCLSVCQASSLSDWHLLAQAHPGSREARDKSQTQMVFSLAILSRARFRREEREKKLFPNPHPVFTDSLKCNCLYKSRRN